MTVHRLETTISTDKTLMLSNLPFEAGDSVEIIIYKRPPLQNSQDRYPLRGQKVVFLEPTEPVGEEDWQPSL